MAKVKTTPRLKIVAIAENESVGEFLAVIKFRKIDGTTGSITQSPSGNIKRDYKVFGA